MDTRQHRRRSTRATLTVIDAIKGSPMADVDADRELIRAKMRDLLTLCFIAKLPVNEVLECAGANPKLLSQIRTLLTRAGVDAEIRHELMVAEMRRQREAFDGAPQGETVCKVVSAAVHGQGHVGCEAK
jgi:hypothetical protein